MVVLHRLAEFSVWIRIPPRMIRLVVVDGVCRKMRGAPLWLRRKNMYVKYVFGQDLVSNSASYGQIGSIPTSIAQSATFETCMDAFPDHKDSYEINPKNECSMDVDPKHHDQWAQ